MEPFLERAS
jgi:hypothetical protein